jgi:hypothetical protein
MCVIPVCVCVFLLNLLFCSTDALAGLLPREVQADLACNSRNAREILNLQSWLGKCLGAILNGTAPLQTVSGLASGCIGFGAKDTNFYL